MRLSSLLLCVALAGCVRDSPAGPGTTPSTARPDRPITRIELRFQDASVPPEYHRSHTITLTPNEVRKIVDVYGEVLSDDRAPLTPGAFERIVGDLRRLDLHPGPDEPGLAAPEDRATTSRSSTARRR